MRFLTGNFMVITIALAISAVAWAYGGSRGSVLPSLVPWLWVLLFEGMICFPQCREDESLVMARDRVWEELRTDPLTWIVCAFMVLLAIPFVNKGLCPICDYPAILMGASAEPPVRFLPFCVNRLEHLTVFLWFLAAFTAMLATRHALLRRGKRLLMELLVWSGVVLAVFGFVQQVFDAHGPFWSDIRLQGVQFFSTFGYANQAGDFFTALFFISLGVWRQHVADFYADISGEERATDKVLAFRDFFWSKHRTLIASGILYFAALSTMSRAAILMATAGAILVFLHVGATTIARLPRIERVKKGAVLALAVVGIAIVASVFMPSRFHREVDNLTLTTVMNRLTGRTEYHQDIAVKLTMQHPLFGVGGWGYKHFSTPYVPKSVSQYFKYDWSNGGANVHNEFLQFMCEHGIVGLLLILTVIFFLLKPVVAIWKSLAATVKFTAKLGLPSPKGFFVFPLPALTILLAALMTVVHSFADCPLRSAAVMMLFFTELAAVEGFLPRLAEKKTEERDW